MNDRYCVSSGITDCVIVVLIVLYRDAAILARSSSECPNISSIFYSSAEETVSSGFGDEGGRKATNWSCGSSTRGSSATTVSRRQHVQNSELKLASNARLGVTFHIDASRMLLICLAIGPLRTTTYHAVPPCQEPAEALRGGNKEDDVQRRAVEWAVCGHCEGGIAYPHGADLIVVRYKIGLVPNIYISPATINWTSIDMYPAQLCEAAHQHTRAYGMPIKPELRAHVINIDIEAIKFMAREAHVLDRVPVIIHKYGKGEPASRGPSLARHIIGMTYCGGGGGGGPGPLLRRRGYGREAWVWAVLPNLRARKRMSDGR
ncbi:hypothetical protein BD779DRAFT_1477372 [Infundibulicybe gibba]|nr:hypothetical protein BD779DRAFT_1477372 [Infundibulicybe gibba]